MAGATLPRSNCEVMDMSKRNDMQRFLRHYKDETGERELDMLKVAQHAAKMGWKMPVPKSPVELLAKEFTAAAQKEHKNDKKTSKPNHDKHAKPDHGQPS